MSILEPRSSLGANDPILDFVLGLHSSSQRCRTIIERLALESREAESGPLPDSFVHVLLGAVAVSRRIEQLVETIGVEPPAAEIGELAPRRVRESLWR
ncbi:MAG: hypothetical protein KF764_01850 [Labilithrix sp.]|nr:hypothetical protein [Labilithrix sp.]